MPVDPLLIPPASSVEPLPDLIPAPEVPLGGDLDFAVSAVADPPPDLEPLSFLNLGHRGGLSGKGHYRSTEQTVEAQVEALAGGADVFVYLHGGLNGEREAGQDASLIIDWLKDTLKMPPLCVLWETRPLLLRVVDALATASSDADTEGGGRLPKRLKERARVGERTLRRHLEVPDGQAIALDAVAGLWTGGPPPRAEPADEGADPQGMDGDEELSAVGAEGLDPAVRAVFVEEAKKERLFGKGRKRAWAALVRTVWRVHARLHHGLWATLLEEVLHASTLREWVVEKWDEMKEKAAAAYQHPPSVYDPNRTGGASYFLDQLNRARGAAVGPGGPPLRLQVWGQSAGTIHASFLVAYVAKHCPHLRVDTLIFTNAGVRFDVFAEAVLPHLDKVSRVVLMGLSAEAEAADLLLVTDPDGYPSSLLTMVSGWLEDEADAALMGLQRMVNGESARGEEPAVAKVGEALRSLGGARFVQEWSPSAALRFTSHGGKAGPVEEGSARQRLVTLFSPPVQEDSPLA